MLPDRARWTYLIAESDDFLLSYEESQFIFTFVVQLGNLNAKNFGADGRSDLFNLTSILQQVLETWIGIFSMLIMLEWLKRRIPMLR